ncbi:hypothetical protein NQZ79_g4886 [Umbelopsis isabellina]|nr:hypothetical protein NQZ79_g4886 [Umbelopsis isabellina]
MDDLSDLVWSDTQKKRPPQLPKKPANLSSQTSSSTKFSDDAFGNLVDFRGQAKPDISKLSLAEQQQSSKSPSPFTPSYSGASPLRPQRYTPSQPSSGYNSDAQTLLEPTVRRPTPTSTNNVSGADAFDSLLDPLGEFGRGSGAKSPASSLNALRSQNSTPSNFSDKGGSNNQRQEHQWDLDLLDQTYGKSPARSSSASPAPLDPFDMDPFEPSPRQQATSSPAWSNQVTDDVDNPLGILAEPAKKIQEKKSPPPASSISSAQSPHADREGLIKQVVDMGFSRDQAVNALDATENGTDVAMAIDLLLQDREAARPQSRSSPRESQRQRPQPQQQQQYRSPTEAARAKIWDDEPKQRAASPSSRQQRPPRSHHDEYGPSDESKQPTFQDQKEKIVTQASELGGYLYKNASLFYKSGREKVSKYMQDMQVENERARSRGNGSPSKPRWMTESSDYNEENEKVPRSGKFEKYADESSDEDPESERQKEEEFRLERERQRKRYVAEQKANQMKQKQKQQQLLDTADTYVSPSRRRGPPSGQSSGRNSPQIAPSSRVTPTPPVANVRRRPARPVVEASPGQIEGANSHKQRGNEQFKLGQYSEAEQAYTQAMSYLPQRHDHLIILYNNRAAALFKNGEYKRTIEDASSAIELIGQDYLDDATTLTIQGVQLAMRDQAIKALSRKAQSLEHLEKYADAITEYNTLLRIDSNGKTTSQTQQGLARCRKSINDADKIEQASKRQTTSSKGQSSGSSNPFSVDFDPITAAAAAPVSAPAVSKIDVDKSQAVKQMRANAAKQSAEEEERLKITDDVDRRLQAWKHGKENNLRALLASLDTVLWSEATWKGANMSELIDPKRCKIVYMKAIAKVHPDKLGSSVTVEQKMLASGIFGTLNHAWDAFKSQNGL